jgi:hypothetical protein
MFSFAGSLFPLTHRSGESCRLTAADFPQEDFLTASVHFSGLRVIQPSGKKRRFKKVSFEQGQLLLRRDVTEQDAEQGEHRVPEGGLVAVPCDRSPHLEPLAADGQEAAHEQDDDHEQANGGHSPGMVERTCPSRRQPQINRPEQNDRGEGLPEDHANVGDVLNGRIGDRPPQDIFIEADTRLTAKVRGVHRQHVLDEVEICWVVGDVADRDQQDVECVDRNDDCARHGQGAQYPDAATLPCQGCIKVGHKSVSYSRNEMRAPSWLLALTRP